MPSTLTTSLDVKTLPLSQFRPAVPIPRRVSSDSVKTPISSATVIPMATATCGPMSSTVTLPARAKPGRKPITGESAVDRRKLQNRQAQRNFRDKRQQKLDQCLQELQDDRVRHRQELAAEQRRREDDRQVWEQRDRQMQSTLQALRDQNKQLSDSLEQLTAELTTLRQRSQEYDRVMSSTRTVTIKPPPPPPIEDHSMHDANEIDFTHLGRNVKYEPITSDFDPSGDAGGCGFCTDDQNCACKQSEQAHAISLPPPSQEHLPGPSTSASIPPATSVIAPGNCDLCRADPARAQACRDMVALRRPSVAVNTSTSSEPSVVRPTLPSLSAGPRISCSELMDRFQQFGNVMNSSSPTGGSAFRGAVGSGVVTYPRVQGGWEIDEEQAAQVLSTMGARIGAQMGK